MPGTTGCGDEVPDGHGGSRPAPQRTQTGETEARVVQSCTTLRVECTVSGSRSGAADRSARSSRPSRCAASRRRVGPDRGAGPALAITTATYGRKTAPRRGRPPQPARPATTAPDEADRADAHRDQVARLPRRDVVAAAGRATVVIRTASRLRCRSRGSHASTVRRVVAATPRPRPVDLTEVAAMTNRTYRVTEIVGTSPDGIDAGHPQRHRAGQQDAAPPRLVRGDPGPWPGQGRRGRALPGRPQARLPARGRVRRPAGVLVGYPIAYVDVSVPTTREQIRPRHRRQPRHRPRHRPGVPRARATRSPSPRAAAGRPRAPSACAATSPTRRPSRRRSRRSRRRTARSRCSSPTPASPRTPCCCGCPRTTGPRSSTPT